MFATSLSVATGALIGLTLSLVALAIITAYATIKEEKRLNEEVKKADDNLFKSLLG